MNTRPPWLSCTNAATAPKGTAPLGVRGRGGWTVMTPIISTSQNQLNTLRGLEQAECRKPNRSNGIHAGQPPAGEDTAIAMSGALGTVTSNSGSRMPPTSRRHSL